MFISMFNFLFEITKACSYRTQYAFGLISYREMEKCHATLSYKKICLLLRSRLRHHQTKSHKTRTVYFHSVWIVQYNTSDCMFTKFRHFENCRLTVWYSHLDGPKSQGIIGPMLLRAYKSYMFVGFWRFKHSLSHLLSISPTHSHVALVHRLLFMFAGPLHCVLQL